MTISPKNLKPLAWDQALRTIRRYEGFRNEAYLDTVGVWTIGYGFTDGVDAGDSITREQAEEYLAERVVMAVNDIRAVLSAPVFDALDAPRQVVMINMAYNLGYRRLSKFLETIKAIKAGDYIAASRQMRASRWCTQVKSRCTDLSASMANGHFIP